MVFTAEGFFEVALESWPEWDLNPRPLNSAQTLNPFDLSVPFGSISLTLVLIGRDGGLSTLCHGCGFACRQRVLKTFTDPGYIRSEDGVVGVWHLLVNFCICIYKFSKPKKNSKE